MNTYAICPISNQKINETVARLNGFFTVVFLVSFVLTSNAFVIGFLFIDFLLRATKNSKFSPLAITSKSIAKQLALKQKMINAGPKIFAARIGLVFSVLILATSLLGLDTAALSLSAIFGVCAFLESAFGFCVACEIYPFVYKFTYQSKIETSKK
ncbi:MAG: DUF4395 domain-containing protein [Paludibacter sp.]